MSMIGALSSYLRDALIGEALGAADWTPPATVYLALSSTIPTPTGITEPTIGTGGYARVAITNDGTSFAAPSGGIVASGIDFAFSAATLDWASGADMVGWALFDAATSGNQLFQGELIGASFVVTADATANTLTKTSHGLNNGDAVEIGSDTGTVPAGLSAATKYYVVNKSTNDFQLAATQGGTAIDLTDAGTGTLRVGKTYKQAVVAGNTPTIPSGAFQVALA